jgi:hypothetical protein
MKVKFNVMATAIAALAAFAAQANPTTGIASPGNGSAFFVAVDNAGTESIAIDLGVKLADFLQASTTPNITANTGGLAIAPADLVNNVVADWTFSTDSRRVQNSAVAGSFAWGTNWANFVTAATSGYKWGVIAGDNVSGAVSATNLVFNRTVLMTGNLTQATISSLSTSTPMSNAPAAFDQFTAAQQGVGTNTATVTGSAISTSGVGFLNTTLKNNFGFLTGFNYLSDVNTTQQLYLAQQASNPVVYQLGRTYGTDTPLSAEQALFAFDGSTLTYIAAVPEPGTYAMLIAGLAAVGFVARRRQA